LYEGRILFENEINVLNLTNVLSLRGEQYFITACSSQLAVECKYRYIESTGRAVTARSSQPP
jgi:hypothetical protein